MCCSPNSEAVRAWSNVKTQEKNVLSSLLYTYNIIWNKALPSEQTHTVTHKSCNIITDNSCIHVDILFDIYIYFPSSPLPYHLLPCMHPLPFPYPILPSLSLLSLPLLSPKLPSHPSSQLRTPPLYTPSSPTQPSHIPYPSLAPPPLHCPIIPLASSTIPYPPTYPPLPYPHLGNCPLPSLLFPQLPSPPLRYPTLSSHLLPFPIYPLLASVPHPTPPLPYPTTLLSPSPPLRSPLPPFTPLH